MRYLGGKHRIAVQLAEVIKPLRVGKIVAEPFCGGLSATVALQPDFASDASVPLMALIRSLRSGWEAPDSLSEEDYQKAKELPPENPLHGFAAFCCSYGGKYWGGYAREEGRNFAKQGKNALMRKIKATEGVSFVCSPYSRFRFDDRHLVYCDPPYRGTTTGYATPRFDHEAFWSWAAIQADRGALVLVSEFTAPMDRRIQVIAKFNSKTDLRKTNNSQDSVENLYLVGA